MMGKDFWISLEVKSSPLSEDRAADGRRLEPGLSWVNLAYMVKICNRHIVYMVGKDYYPSF